MTAVRAEPCSACPYRRDVDKVPHGHDLLAARLGLLDGPVPDETVPLFDSHTEAAEHGLRDIDRPGEESCEVQERLIRKYERLRS